MSSPSIQKLARLASFRASAKTSGHRRAASLNPISSFNRHDPRADPAITHSTAAPTSHDDPSASHHTLPAYVENPSTSPGMVVVQEWNQSASDADVDMDDWARYCM